MDFYFRVKIFFNIKRILGVVVGGQFIVWMLGQIVLFTQKGAHTAQLQDALSAIQHSKLIAAHKFMAKLLERCAIRRRVTAGIRCVEAVDGLFAKRFGKFFQGSRLAAAQKNLRVHVRTRK